MLSIIIPTLDEENYLPILLQSIKNQSFKLRTKTSLVQGMDYEVIIADANSIDRTVEIAKSYGCKIVAGGLPANGRNEGAKIANGNIFLFIDAEAVFPERFLAKALLEFKERKLDIASCGLEPITKNKVYKILHSIFYNLPARLLEDIFPYASNFILIKKEIHQRMGGFDEGITLGEDHAYVRKGAKIAKFGFLKSPKLTLLPRRFQNEGWLTISAKYYFCNLYNIFFGNVRSNIFKYNLKTRNEKKKQSKVQKIIFTVLRSPFYIIWFLFGFATWLIIFLILTPKLIVLYLKKRRKNV